MEWPNRRAGEGTHNKNNPLTHECIKIIKIIDCIVDEGRVREPYHRMKIIK